MTTSKRYTTDPLIAPDVVRTRGENLGKDQVAWSDSDDQATLEQNPTRGRRLPIENVSESNSAIVLVIVALALAALAYIAYNYYSPAATTPSPPVQSETTTNSAPVEKTSPQVPADQAAPVTPQPSAPVQ